MYPRPTGEVYLCGLGGSDYVDPPRLKAGGDCDKPELIGPDPARVAAASKSFKGMTSLGNEPPTVSQVCKVNKGDSQSKTVAERPFSHRFPLCYFHIVQ